jgi:uncharacterized protein (TIGR00730 family)
MPALSAVGVRGFGQMTNRQTRRGTGNPEIDQRINETLDALEVNQDRDQLFEIMATTLQLATDGADRLDLKITNAALREMRHAFQAFGPYTDYPKVTIFGSARTLPTDPLYDQARTTARILAEQGWMVVTGAGPGIMAAGLEGAGREKAFGINIRLPFEQSANEFIATDPKLVTMKYFFTRKLMLIKESDGFIVLPGGYGTLDETFELLTLVQTGKAEPTPIVLLEVPGGNYWRAWSAFIDEVKERGLISPSDDVLFRITDSAQDASREVLDFYRNYHSRRFVGSRLVMRLLAEPTVEEVEALSAEFSDLCVQGGIEKIEPLPSEINDNDELDKGRIAFEFDRVHHGRLRQLINRVNSLDSAPDEQPSPRHYQEPQS